MPLKVTLSLVSRPRYSLMFTAYVAKVETLEKTPLKAQTLPDGTEVVIPGGGEAKNTVKLSAEEKHFKRTQDYLAEYDKRKQAVKA